MQEPEEVAFDRAYVAKFGLYGFLKLIWPIIDPGTPFLPNWHLEEISTHLEAVAHGFITRLLINVPPGTGKSKLSGVAWPAHTWINYPSKKWIFGSYDQSLASRDARATKELIETEWYQARWPAVQILDNADTAYRVRGGGWRWSTSPRGKVTGRHCDIQVVDDPIKPKDTQGKAAVTRNELEFVKQWWNGTMSTRMANPKTCARVIVMQRLHEDDLCGAVLAGSDRYQHLRLPMRFEPENKCVTEIHTPRGVILRGDRRTEPGELLHAARFGEAQVAMLEAELNVYSDAQLQQRPGRHGGQIFQSAWFRYWDECYERQGQWYVEARGETFTIDEWALSWDMTFKDTIGSDFVCGQVWARSGSSFFLIDRVYERMNFPMTLTSFQTQCRQYPQAIAKLIEDKANGPAVISSLERKIAGLIARTPLGSKIARANAVSPLHRAGNVYYPNPLIPGKEWVQPPAHAPAAEKRNGHVAQMTGFPLAKHDDSVDAETQMLAYFHENHNTLFDALPG